jgi:hypothetical protein
MAIKKYATAKLGQFSCEMVSQYIHTQVIPQLVKEKRNAMEDRC